MYECLGVQRLLHGALKVGCSGVFWGGRGWSGVVWVRTLKTVNGIMENCKELLGRGGLGWSGVVWVRTVRTVNGIMENCKEL